MESAGLGVVEIHCSVESLDTGLVGESGIESLAACRALDAVTCLDYLLLVEVSSKVSRGWSGKRDC
jgi:hypothetical protein